MDQLDELICKIREQNAVSRNSTAGQNRRQKNGVESSAQGDTILARSSVAISMLESCCAPSGGAEVIQHGYFELVYIYRGCCHSRIAGRDVKLKQGDLHLLSANIEHSFSTGTDSILFLIQISSELVEKSIIPIMSENQMFMCFFVDYLYRGSQNEQHLLFDHNSTAVLQLVEHLICEYYLKGRQHQGIVQCSLSMLFCYLARDYEDSTILSAERPGSGILIYEMITYISQHSATVTLDSLSRQFQYSPGYLSRLIRKLTGKNFSEILHYHKFNLATQYLETTSLPISEVAHQVGFTDSMHFNKAFKTRFGKTPTEYRKACQRCKQDG